MAPFGGQPGVVVVEPADHGADVKGGLNRVEFAGRAGHAGPAGQLGPRNHGPQQPAAVPIAKRQKCAAQTVHQAQPGRFVGRRALDRGAYDVVGHLDKNLVRRGPIGRSRGGHRKLTFSRVLRRVAVLARGS